jgi:hypothetical protein
MDFVDGHAVDFSFCDSDAFKDCEGLFFYPQGQGAVGDQFLNLGESSLVVSV